MAVQAAAKAHKKQKKQHKNQNMVNRNSTMVNMQDGYIVQKRNVQEVTTAWDRMLIAKQCPGQYNVEYVSDMNSTNLPTSCFEVSRNISSCDYVTTDNFPFASPDTRSLGSGNYTVLAWMPSLSAFHGSDSHNHIARSEKLGGFAILQEDDLYLGVLAKETFLHQRFGQTMFEAYGSDMTAFAHGGYVWTAEMECNILAPAANMIGAMYRGSLSFGQLEDKMTNGLSIEQLVKISGEAMKVDHFHMRSGVVNHGLVY